MRLIGLTGGIASGKSTVARMLARRGAIVIDADVIAREVVEPGKPAHAAIEARFGSEVISPDGSIDRTKLGAIVFADDGARADLNAITHPDVLAEISRRIEELRHSDAVVVADIPLLLESGSRPDGFETVLVVAASPDEQIDRLRRDRGMSDADARARLAAQASMDAKRAAATYVIENSGTLDDLESAVGEFWSDLALDA